MGGAERPAEAKRSGENGRGAVGGSRKRWVFWGFGFWDGGGSGFFGFGFGMVVGCIEIERLNLPSSKMVLSQKYRSVLFA